MKRADFVQAQRLEAWAAGRALADSLLGQYCEKYKQRTLPPPAKVIDELLTEFLGCELARAPLGVHVFAQTEWIGDVTIVTVNSETSRIQGVKDVQGVENVAKWHEAIHVINDQPSSKPGQGMLAGFEAADRIVCRRGEQADHSSQVAAREFFAEEAGRAAAVSPQHLRWAVSFHRLIQGGGRLSNASSWHYLYEAAADLGVNISALVTQLELEGLIVVETVAGKRLLHVQPTLASFLEANG